jgi:hypothetical protein
MVALVQLGVWATSATQLRAIRLTGQAIATRVDVGTLRLSTAARPQDAVQLRVRLFAAAPTPRRGAAEPARHRARALEPGGRAGGAAPGDPALWDRRIPVPACSQMVYPDGGEVWCSPTSTAMVLAYWGYGPAPCEPGVRAAVDGVFDWVYDGHGNWPFNTAYAANLGLAAQVARFTSLADAEPWIAAGVPVIFTFSWRPGEIDGVALPSTTVIWQCWSASTRRAIRCERPGCAERRPPRVYDRRQIERAWPKSGGTVWCIRPDTPCRHSRRDSSSQSPPLP